MTAQTPTSAPTQFIRVLRRAHAATGLSLRDVARKAAISPAYLSRLIAGERGAPEDGVIERLESVLDIQPRGQLFDAAGRHDRVVAKVMNKDGDRILMRALAPLSADDFAKVVRVAQELAVKYQGNKR